MFHGKALIRIASIDIWNLGTHNNKKVTHHGALDHYQPQSI